jgi:hypothetical protein
LSVFRGSLIARYGLKDDSTLETKERVKSGYARPRVWTIVDEMVRALDEMDGQTDPEAKIYKW